MEHECVEPFYPFKGYSAWFSSSVHPDIVKKWDYFGGQYGDKEDSDFLFSENAFTGDTKVIHDKYTNFSVLRPQLIIDILKARKPLHEVPTTEYILHPYSLSSTSNGNSLMNTPKRKPPSTLPPIKSMGGTVNFFDKNHVSVKGINTRENYAMEVKIEEDLEEHEAIHKPLPLSEFNTKKLKTENVTSQSASDHMVKVECEDMSESSYATNTITEKLNTVPFSVGQKYLHDIVHIDALEIVHERFTDISPNHLKGLIIRKVI